MDTMRFCITGFDRASEAKNETLFSLANGYLGLRGSSEEREGSHHAGTYINGFYDSEPIVYGESAYGFAKNHETMLNLPDPKRIEITVDSRPFSLLQGTVERCKRVLDFRTGVLSRLVEWTNADGIGVVIESRRLVSFVDRHCAVVVYTVTAREKPVSLTMESSIDFRTENAGFSDDPRMGSKFSGRPLRIEHHGIDGDDLSFHAVTRNSGLHLFGSVHHELSRACDSRWEEGDAMKLGYAFSLQPGESVTMTKYIRYADGPDAKSPKVVWHSFDDLVQRQRTYLDAFWHVAAIEIEGDRKTEQAMHFALFHLLQACGADGRRGMAAKGLTGEGYEGHYFWDTEAYALPVFAYLKPDLAEHLLAFRHAMLPQARSRAYLLHLDGALFPWRTISGEECSAYFPAGTAQYHIDADIVHAARLYVDATGIETPPWIVTLAVETARMWLSLGAWIPARKNRFCIDEVTGPDEYSACVDNNCYTNAMAQENLGYAASLVRHYRQRGRTLPLQVGEDEIAAWEKAARDMYLPFDDAMGIYLQDDGFAGRPDWPFDQTPKDSYPLLLHYHPLEIYRHRVLKQPDVVLAQFLLPSRFSKAEKIRNFLFYEPYTTGDSSLSPCIQSIMANEAFQSEKAWRYFQKTVRLDMDDIHGNSSDGIHTAAMAGSWMALVHGFAGFRDWQGTFRFNEQVPKTWKSVRFSLLLHGSLLRLAFDAHRASYTLLEGKALSLTHRNESFVLEPGQKRTFSLDFRLRGVLFDLDGVIVDTATLHYRAWKQLCDEAELVFDRRMNDALRGVGRSESLSIILERNNVVWDEERCKKALVRKNDIYVAFLETLTPDRVYPGILSLLEELKKRNIKTALASASRNARTVCMKLGILDRFDVIVDVSKVQMPKPHPDIFLAAAEQLGLWYADCLGIEDAEAGINAIKAAGMKAVGVGPRSRFKGADAVVPETAALTFDLLAGLFP